MIVRRGLANIRPRAMLPRHRKRALSLVLLSDVKIERILLGVRGFLCA